MKVEKKYSKFNPKQLDGVTITIELKEEYEALVILLLSVGGQSFVRRKEFDCTDEKVNEVARELREKLAKEK